MTKKYIKKLKKLPSHLQFQFIDIITKIHNHDLEGLDIKEISGKRDFFRCRTGKFRIIFYKDLDDDYVIYDIGSRGDIYK